jgi:multidrug efflux pump subunit AcrA (membrane-fusion protein)
MHRIALTVLLLIGILSAPILAQEKPADQKAEPPKGPATATVKKDYVRVDTTIKGVFESTGLAEVRFDLSEFSKVRPHDVCDVKSAVAHGTRVSTGQVLVELECEELTEVIEGTQRSIESQEHDLTDASIALKKFESGMELQLESAARSKRIAEEELKFFSDTSREWSVKRIEQGIKRTLQSIDYELEELRQLELMYEADDLTEETEEIILTRQKNYLENLRFGLESRKVDAEREKTVDLERAQESLESKVENETLKWTHLENELKQAIAKKKMALAHDTAALERTRLRLTRLMADRDNLVIKSPADGMVYYGSCTRGSWSGADAYASRLVPGGQLKPGKSVILTVVNTDSMVIRAGIPEKDLHHLTVGSNGTATPTGSPDTEVEASIQSIDTLPVQSGSWDAILSVSAPKAVLPGMTCSVKFTTYRNPDGLLLPANVVFTDKSDDSRYVYLVTGEKKHEKRIVTVGKTVGKSLEILSGVAEGDNVLVKKP